MQHAGCFHPQLGGTLSLVQENGPVLGSPLSMYVMPHLCSLIRPNKLPSWIWDYLWYASWTNALSPGKLNATMLEDACLGQFAAKLMLVLENEHKNKTNAQ